MATWSIEWNLLDEFNNPIGLLKSSGGTVAWDGGATIQRVVRGAKFDLSEWKQVNPFKDRLRLLFVNELGDSFSMGVFYVAQLPRTYIDFQNFNSPEPYLVDGGFFLDQPSTFGFSGRLGERLSDVMERICDLAGISNRLISPCNEFCGEPILAPPGETFSRSLAGIARLANFLPPHFDRNGVLKLVPIPPISAKPSAVYGPETIVKSSRVEDDNLLDAPNVFLVLGSGASSDAISAVAEVPGSAPHSVQNRGGREVVKVQREQGIDSVAQAVRLAESLALTSASDYETISFQTVPNPNHDCYEIVEVNGVSYRERQWEMPLRAGGEMMSHFVDRSDNFGGD